MRFALAVTVLAAALAGCALPRGEAPQAMPAGAMGQRPGYPLVLATSVPNEAAIGRRIFTPGLDDDFVPQGLAVVGDHILVSSYKPTPDLNSNNGPCRVFRIEARTGKPAGQFDIPLEAQGAAFDRDGNVWITASKSNLWSKLYRIDRKGNVVAEYDMPIGLEGIAFDASGKLWAMTESGTRKYLRWGDQFNFPYVFEVDVAKLK